jgi:hypothetical protein
MVGSLLCAGQLDQLRERLVDQDTTNLDAALFYSTTVATCGAPGFHQGSLTLMILSNTLTLVKEWSTWVITSKT